MTNVCDEVLDFNNDDGDDHNHNDDYDCASVTKSILSFNLSTIMYNKLAVHRNNNNIALPKCIKYKNTSPYPKKYSKSLFFLISSLGFHIPFNYCYFSLWEFSQCFSRLPDFSFHLQIFTSRHHCR